MIQQSIVNTDGILPTKIKLNTVNNNMQKFLQINIENNHIFERKCIVIDWLCTTVFISLDLIHVNLVINLK